MSYYGIKFERRDPEREAEYDAKHLADCNEVKTYKLTPEEIEKRYGACKGSGKEIDSLVNIRNLTKKDDDEMSKIYDTDEALEAVKKLMEAEGLTEHIPGAAMFSKKLKKYEATIYGPLGGMSGVAEKLGLPTLSEYNGMVREKERLEKAAAKIKPIEDVTEEVFEKVYVQAHPEPEVVTMTSEPIGTEISAEEIMRNEYKRIINRYRELLDKVDYYKSVYNQSRNILLNHEFYKDGFETAAKLAGVSLE